MTFWPPTDSGTLGELFLGNSKRKTKAQEVKQHGGLVGVT